MEALFTEPFYSFVFIGLGLLFLFLEVFVPTGGVLGVLSVGCVAFGIFGLFQQGNTLLGVGAIVGTSVAIILGIRFGLSRLSFRGIMTPQASSSVDEKIEGLDGKEGVAYTPLRPAGMAIIDGRKIDVVAQGDLIQKGTAVRVVDTSGNRVVVRAVSSGGKTEGSRPDDLSSGENKTAS